MLISSELRIPSQQGRAQNPRLSSLERKRRHVRLNSCSSCSSIEGMKILLTAKLKLLTTPDQFAALRATQLAYRDALNLVSAYAFANRKTSSIKRLQQATYADL